MYAAVSKIGKRIVATFLIGIVIKMIDNYIDENKLSLAHKLGMGVAPYSLLLFAMAVSLDPGPVCTLFFAAYIVGMIKEPHLILPTYLPTWGESFLVTAGGVFLWGWPEMLSSLTIMTCVQLIDDYLDRELDRKKGYNNLVHRWGRVEVLLASIIVVIISLQLDWGKSLLVLFLAPIINLLSTSREKKEQLI